MITAYFDGGARGNPGPAGYGVFIVDDQGHPLAELSGALGIATNNVAEYNGLIAALEWAVGRGLTQLHVRGDSQLLIEQMRGNYKVKNEGLKPLHAEARQAAARVGAVRFESVPRDDNGRADGLVNEALDLALRRGSESPR